MIVVNLLRNENTEGNNVIIGVYYPNGVFCELDSEIGISYILDHILFEQLQTYISDKGYGYVKGYTYFGYSCFLVKCNNRDIFRNIEVMHRVLFEESLPYADISEWVKHRRVLARTLPTPVEQQYYASRLGETPLSKTLSQSLTNVPTIDRMQEWRKQFVCEGQVACYITGANMAVERINNPAITLTNGLPCFERNTSVFPRQIPWLCGYIIYSIPFVFTAENILVSEVCCEILKKRISPIVRKIGGRLDSIQICPDYISEIRIRLLAFRGSVTAQANSLEDFFSNLSPITQQEHAKAYFKVKNTYDTFLNNPLEVNKFLGYNLLSGSRFDLKGLLSNSMSVKLDDVENIFAVLREKKGHNVFATPSY